MTKFNPAPLLGKLPGAKTRWFSGLVIALGMTFLQAGSAFAVAPPANSVIGNQASATYTDASGQTKAATSNLVETTVQQVGSFTLVQDNTKTAAIGNTVYMPHTLTNTGNGSDSFTLTTSDLGGADTDFATNIAIYLDANADGVPDSTTPLCSGLGCSATTVSLPSGGTYSFVVSMTVPGTALAGESDGISVTATAGTPGLYTTPSASSTNTLNVTGSAAFQVNKSISASQGPTGVTLTYTLTYKNIGAAAGDLALHDVIGSGATAGYAYVANSAIWSAGATVLTDVAGDTQTVGGSNALYAAVTAAGVTSIDATVTNVGPNVTGTITFQTSVLPTATVGTSTTTNTASYGVDTTPLVETNNGTDATSSTNPSPYNVLASYSLVLNDGTGSATDGSNIRPLAGDNDSTPNADLRYVATASPSQTVSFDNTVWNTGNTADTFNITATGLAGGGGYGAWPSGTTFQLYKSDGFTPLLDTNGDGIPDTGSVDSGASYKVVLKATLPASACTPACPTGPFDVEKVAKSVNDPTQSNKTYDRLGALTAPTVDLANSTGTVDTLVNQDVVGASPTITNSTLPGGSVVFDLFVRNEGGVADTYSLAYSGTNAFSPTSALPAGWTVQLRTTVAGVCSATGGTVISSVGPVAAGSESHVCAVVSAPGTALAGNVEVYFQAQSESTGATDVIWDRVTVSEVNSLTVQPSHTGQIFPGGTVVYPHVLSNTGNTSCGTSFTFAINESLSAQGWTFVLYKDENGDGLIDGGDTVISGNTLTGTSLAPGTGVNLLIKVFAPGGAVAGATDVVDITATGDCGLIPTSTTSNTATDTTSVVTGQVRLEKTQAIDGNCDGTPDAPPYTNAPLAIYPGQCILYKVVATNEGLGNVSALTISDSLPAYTLFGAGPTCSTGTPAYTLPTFSCSGITLAPAATATMDIRVQVQQ